MLISFFLERVWKLGLLVLIGLFLVACVTAPMVINNTSDGCYIKLQDKTYLMTCPKHLPDLISQEQIDESIEQFSKFLNSTKADRALKRSLERDKAGVEIDPETLYGYGEEIDMMIGRRYIAMMSFRNSSYLSYGRRYGNPFKNTEEPIGEWTHRLLVHTLGNQYEWYSPKVLSVSEEIVRVQALFLDASDLKVLLGKYNLVSLRHIATPAEEIEEILVNLPLVDRETLVSGR